MEVDISITIDSPSAPSSPFKPQSYQELPEVVPEVATPTAAAIHDPHHDCVRPIFHVMPAAGWASDPSGPVYYKGRYHMFFQHLRTSCQWYWGLCWDHVVSTDLVHWRKLPPALVPTPDWYDADGAFSGTVELDPESGVPVILYTGVYLKANKGAVAALGLPPAPYDMPTRFVETQLAAVPADPDDPDLTHWVKLPEPVARYPPPHNPFSCWRDPFCLVRGDPGAGREWVFLLASGVTGRGGAVLVYKARHLLRGWRYVGVLAAQGDMSLGQDWECPVLTRLPELRAGAPSSAAALLPGHLALPAEALVAPWAALGTTPAAGPYTAALAQGTTLTAAATQEAAAAAGGAAGGGVAAAVDAWLEGQPLHAAKGVGEAATAAAGLASEAAALVTATAAAAVQGTEGVALAGEGGHPAPLPGTVPRRLTRQQVEQGLGEVAAGTAPAAARQVLVEVAGATRRATSPTTASSSSSAEGTSSPRSLLSSSSMADMTVEGKGGVGLASAGDLASLVSSGDETTHPAGDAAVCGDAREAAQLLSELMGPGGLLGEGVAAAAAFDGGRTKGLGQLVAVGSTSSMSVDEVVCDARLCCSASAASTDAHMAAVAASGQGSGQDGPTAAAGVTPGPWFFCVSPDACNYPIRYWLGRADLEGTGAGGCPTFDLAGAAGPFKLDLGRTLYAASLWPDPAGRQLLWGWIQEHRRVPPPPCECADYDYAGCLSTPRVLFSRGGRLHQAPLPELALLRSRVSWHTSSVTLVPGDAPLPLRVVSGTHLDLEASFAPPASGSGRVGFILRSWRPGGVGAAVVSFDWSTRQLVVDFDQTLPHAYDPHPEDVPMNKRVGGTLDNMEPGAPLELRLLLDGSALEIFTGSGETLTSRVYRGAPAPTRARAAVSAAAAAAVAAAGGVLTQPATEAAVAAAAAAADDSVAGEDGADADIDVFAAGEGPVLLSRLDVWEMCSGWVGGSGPKAPGGTPPSPSPYAHTAVVAPAFLQGALGACAGEDMED